MGKEMENMKNNVVEKNLNPASGMLMLILSIVGILAGVFLIIAGIWASSSSSGMAAVLITAGVLLMILCFILMGGLKILNPNEALVLTLFGKYYGTIKKDGFYFVNPFCTAFNPSASSFSEEITAELMESAGLTPHLTGSGGCLYALGGGEKEEKLLRSHGFGCFAVRCAPAGVEEI